MAAVIPCGVALIRRGNEFLIAQRKKDDSFGSLWEFPGGKKDEGESFEECVVREVKEETGIDVRVDAKFMEMRRPYHERIIWLNFFLCTYVAGDAKALDCECIEWVTLDRMKDFKFPPANGKVIQRLKEHALK